MSQELAINEQLSKKIRDKCKQWQNPKQQFPKMLKILSFQRLQSLRQPRLPRPLRLLRLLRWNPSEAGAGRPAPRTKPRESRFEWSPFRSLNRSLRQPNWVLRQTQHLQQRVIYRIDHPLSWSALQVQSPLPLARSSARLRRTCSTSGR